MKYKMIIDSHIHYSYPKQIESVIEALNEEDARYGNLVAQILPKYSSETIDVLFGKLKSKGRLYCFGSLDPTAYINQENMSEKLINHVKNLILIGCDGIKMLEGKPEVRKQFPIPDFDLPIWDDFFNFLEEEQINVIWHVNDPIEFWDLNKIPSWAKDAGWYYDDTFVNYHKQLNQLINRLNKNPNLNITFAHFLFLSNDLDLLQTLFDKFPHISVDIAPGIELFINLAQNIDKSRAFFIKNQDRIIYGTDICRLRENLDDDFNIKDGITRGKLCKGFLLDEHLSIKGDKKSLLGADDFIIPGLNLPFSVSDKILAGNFLNKVNTPRSVNIELLKEEIEKEKARIKILSKYFNFIPDFSYLDAIKKEINHQES